jgi:RNA recognition motif-containing protein
LGTEYAFVKKIYVGNLPWSTTDEDLRELFATYGPVQSSSVVNDRETGRSRGFGFVEMAPADADKAISELDGRDYGGRALRVNEALDKRRGGGGGGDRDNRGGGDRGDRGGRW